MLKRKASEYNNNIKRVCYNKEIKLNKIIYNLFGNLPYEIIFNILGFLDIIDIKKIELNIPSMNEFISKINFSKIEFDNDEKERLLLKTFETKNINIIRFVFDNIKYCDINEILINFDQFQKVISGCVKNSFFDGIDYLIKWKETHFEYYQDHNVSLYKNMINSNQNVILTQFVENIFRIYTNYQNNKSNLLDMVIYNMFMYNNLELCNHIIINYNSSDENIFILMEEQIEVLFQDDNYLMLEKILSVNNKQNDLLDMFYRNTYNLCVEHNRLKCLDVLLKMRNGYKYIPDNSTINNILEENRFDIFNIIYENNRDYFDDIKVKEFFNTINIVNINIDITEYLLQIILKDKPEYFLYRILDEDNSIIKTYKLIEKFGNLKYINYSDLVNIQNHQIYLIYIFSDAYDKTSDNDDIKKFKEALLNTLIIWKIKQNY